MFRKIWYNYNDMIYNCNVFLKALGAKAPDPDPDENEPEWESEAGE